jgi:Tfp pilus assembly protein PilX
VIYIIGIDKISKLRFFCEKKLNQKMKPVLVRSDKGFVLPLSVAVGAILMLLGVMMIMRASQGDKTAIAAKSTSRSQAVAEAGVTNFQSLMNRYKALSTYTYCSSVNAPINSSDPKCSNQSSATTWSTVSERNFCGTPPSTQPGEDYANLVKDYSDDFLNDTWQNSNGGQFRLVRYIYTPEPPGASSVPRRLGGGELLVEGRVDQENNGSASYRTSTTRLEVAFENWMERLTDADINSLPALWIRANQVSSASSNVTFSPTSGFSIWDSTPPVNCNHANVQLLRNRLASADDTYKLTSPELSFPTLPSEGAKPLPTPGIGVYVVPPIINPTPLLVPSQGVSNNRITFITSSINLARGEILNIQQPAPSIANLTTVALYVDGNLNIEEGGKILVENGLQFIIYVHGSVTLNSNNATKSIDSSSVTKLFSYTNDPIVIRGDSEIKLFVLAPNASVTFENNARVSGAVWAQSWIGRDSTSLVREFSSNFLSQLPIDIPRMRPISSWRRCTIAAAPDCS